MNRNTTEFRIEQSWGDKGRAYIYFTADKNTPIEKLKEMVKNEVTKDWRKMCQTPKILGTHIPCRPTVKVVEYDNGKKTKKGITFKIKWR